MFPTGTTSVTCTARDAALNTATKSFTVTVQLLFGFGGFDVPATANQGSAVPLLWQYLSGATPSTPGRLFRSSRVRTLTSCTNGIETGVPFLDKQAPGNSDFNYDVKTFTWHFNWQTKLFCGRLLQHLHRSHRRQRRLGPGERPGEGQTEVTEEKTIKP